MVEILACTEIESDDALDVLASIRKHVGYIPFQWLPDSLDIINLVDIRRFPGAI